MPAPVPFEEFPGGQFLHGTKADLKPDSCWDLKALQAEAAAK